MKKFLVALAITTVAFSAQAKAEESLLTQVSNFESAAQIQLEQMVVNRSVDVAAINAQIENFSSKLSSLSKDDAEIANNILGEIGQAAALVQIKA